MIRYCMCIQNITEGILRAIDCGEEEELDFHLDDSRISEAIKNRNQAAQDKQKLMHVLLNT